VSSEDPIRVSLTGDRTGAYVVSEERPDGSLVLEPDGVQPTQARHDEGVARPAGALGELLLGLFKDRPTATVPELLHRWGVTLNPGEDIRQFLTLQVNEVNGFAAVTTSRLIFMPQGGNARGPAEEYRLAAVRNVEVVGRRRTRLRVETSRGSMTIEAGRDEIQQLAGELAPQSPSSTGAEPA
jgi:hypothetical protein